MIPPVEGAVRPISARRARAWLWASLGLFALLVAVHAAQNALLRRAIGRINARGGSVFSYTDPGWVPGASAGRAPILILLPEWIQDRYVVRASYEVHFGEMDLGCGVDLTLVTSGHHDHDTDDDGLAVVADLPRVRGLFLRSTSITDAGLAHLRRLASIEDLDLSGTVVTDAGLASIEQLPSLRHVNLCGTRVTQGGALGSTSPAIRAWAARTCPVR